MQNNKQASQPVPYRLDDQAGIQLGHYVTCREKQPLDYVPINLSTIAAKGDGLNTSRNEHHVAMLWKHMTDTDDARCSWILQKNSYMHPEYTYVRQACS